MGEIADRYRTVAAGFTARVADTPVDRWQAPAPCEGWVALDVVRHLVEWVPGFLAARGIELPPGPSVEADPLGAWQALDAAIQARLDDPALAQQLVDSPMGEVSFETAIATFVLADVLIHTWDLARAAGLDEALDEAEVARSWAQMATMDDAPLRESGHFGPRTPVPDDADEQTQLLAFMGRTP